MRELRKQKAVIGDRLRRARELARISKEEAAEAAGAQAIAVASWERGSTLPSLVQLPGLLACYGVTSYQVLFGSSFPVALTQEEATELAAAEFSPRLARKRDVLLTLLGRADSVSQTA